MTYDEPAVSGTVAELLRDATNLDPSADGALDDLDQFHLGGAEAVDLLVASLDLDAGALVLDVGSGFGGPARQVARRTGARVLGVDLAPAYVEAARDLTRRAGLEDLVEFRHVDIADLDHGAPFDAAITMHVQMNVEDKTAWFRKIARRLAPGARLAVWEVCQQPGSELTWPMPWSLDGSDSFVVPQEELRRAVEDAGFVVESWTDRSGWARDWFERTYAAGGPGGPALPMLLDEGYTRVLNYAAAVADGSVQVWQGCFTTSLQSRS
ncbi:MAG TPA: methyltransferase domain-containing protein [Nocardioides sp.]|uniref:SAM-dependent methyltransferase n=1 Tax=Nocardioides sp. TaxID=35761 RepID=UPI002E322C8C|nr:methyltransferase domain-containing protein [Nocardioides sp.]HEX5088582.1 methyltransferase domain-containing protein [Nocardioides sp.]